MSSILPVSDLRNYNEVLKNCKVGDTKTLTFEATDNWILISSSLWCYFEQDGEQTFTCSGGVGEQTVTIHISDDATELMKSYKAELTMTMAGSRQVIAEVTRPSTGYELHAFDASQFPKFLFLVVISCIGFYAGINME